MPDRRPSSLARRPAVVGIVLVAVVAALALVASTPAAALDAPGNNETDAGNDTVSVVVTFDDHDARDPAVVRRVGGTVTGGDDVTVAPVLFADVPADALARLRAAPGVAAVERDRRVRIADLDATATRETTQQAGDRWWHERLNTPTARAEVPPGGQSAVDVAVVDTGVDTDHPQLAPALEWGLNTTGEDVAYGTRTAEDRNGHGTYTTGIVAAAEGERAVGVSPGVDLYAVKVLDGNFGRISDVVQGIDAVLPGPDGELGTADDPDVISISLGGGFENEAERRAVENASEVAVVVASAGNSGDGDPETDEVSYPAGFDEAIAVAATTEAGTTPEFSSEGAAVEIAAPGVDVESTALDGGTRNASGTSVSAPFVAGAAALVIAEDLADGQRDLSPGEVRERLQTATQDLATEGRDNSTGFGEIRVDAAVRGESVPDALEVRLDSPADGEQVTGITEIVATVADADQPVVEVSIDGGAWRAMQYDPDRDAYTYDWDSGGFFDGDYSVRVRAREDGVAVTDAATVTVNGNGERPAVRIVDPSAGEQIEGNVTVVVEAADAQTDAENLTVEVALGDGEYREADYLGGNDYLTEIAVERPPGNATLRARATDTRGEESTASIPVVVDEDDPPAISVFAPRDGTTVAGTVRLIASPFDDRTPVEAVTMEYRVDGGEWRPMKFNEFFLDYEANVSAYRLVDGKHTIEFRADDGNLTATRDITVDVRNRDLSSPDLVLTADGDTVEPGENATIEVRTELRRDAESLRTFVNGLPDGWEVVDVDRDDGRWLADSRSWFWFRNLDEGRTVTPTVTVSVPENATGSAGLTVVSVTDDDRAAGVAATVIVGGGSPVVEAIAGDDGRIQAGEVLAAIQYYNTGQAVPGTDGQTLGAGELLEIISRYNERER